MGLNWAAGFAGAARGAEFLQKDNAKNIDQMYKEISDANLRRFRSGEAQTQRDFLAKEKGLDRGAQSDRWDAQDKNRDQDRAERATRDAETAEYRRQQQENQATQADATQEHRGDVLDATKQNRADLSDDRKSNALRQRQDSVARRFADKRKGVAYAMLEDSEKAKIDDDEQVALARTELENKGALAFDKAYRKMGSSRQAVSFALNYGRMSADDRSAVDEKAASFEAAGDNRALALSKAIDNIGGFTDERSSALPSGPDSSGQVRNPPKTGEGGSFFENIKKGFGFGAGQ